MALEINDPVPWFDVRSNINPNFHFETIGGKRIVLFFFGSSTIPGTAEILADFQKNLNIFDQLKVPIFAVSIDDQDEGQNLVTKIAPDLTYFWDFDKKVSEKYGVCQPVITNQNRQFRYSPCTFILSENLRILNIFTWQEPQLHIEKILRFLQALPPLPEPREMGNHPPVLSIPNVLDPDFCRYLIQMYEANGGGPSGFMRQVDGKTVGLLDPSFKRRKDFLIEDNSLKTKINDLIIRRVAPEVKKAYQFNITRVERYLVACYEATDRGFFKAHRDNTSSGTLHRRFAMTLNLNTGEYEGGYLWFPEYGAYRYRPQIGEAIIFSCSLLHEATPVISGTRYTLLSFFYGDEDAIVRDRNKHLVASPSSPNDMKNTSQLPSENTKERSTGYVSI